MNAEFEPTLPDPLIDYLIVTAWPKANAIVALGQRPRFLEIGCPNWLKAILNDHPLRFRNRVKLDYKTIETGP